jgi:LPXTG-motif cell wall-anchored protein
METTLQGAIWLGAGITLVMLLSRRRKRKVVR